MHVAGNVEERLHRSVKRQSTVYDEVFFAGYPYAVFMFGEGEKDWVVKNLSSKRGSTNTLCFGFLPENGDFIEVLDRPKGSLGRICLGEIMHLRLNVHPNHHPRNSQVDFPSPTLKQVLFYTEKPDVRIDS